VTAKPLRCHNYRNPPLRELPARALDAKSNRRTQNHGVTQNHRDAKMRHVPDGAKLALLPENHFCVIVTHRAGSLITFIPTSLGPPAPNLS
jgi:hypothetical protein